MALSKMVGFEVSPRRSSSSIKRCSSPLATSRRSIWSYQTLWPTFASSTSGLLMLESPPFFLVYPVAQQRDHRSHRSYVGHLHREASADPVAAQRDKLKIPP